MLKVGRLCFRTPGVKNRRYQQPFQNKSTCRLPNIKKSHHLPKKTFLHHLLASSGSLWPLPALPPLPPPGARASSGRARAAGGGLGAAGGGAGGGEGLGAAPGAAEHAGLSELPSL